MNLFADISLPFNDMSQWGALAVGVFATFYILMRSKAKRRKADPMERVGPTLSLSQQRQIERDISNLMVEMLETARQMTAQLDNRAMKLELLMKEADQKLAAFKSVTSIDPAKPPIPPDLKETPSLDILKPNPAEIPPDPRHGEIYSLADQGRSPQEIARRLNRPNGEVELILALRQR